MKKLLFVIGDLYAGGAQKSLVSLLNELAEAYPNEYEVDLLVCSGKGVFYDQIPQSVNILDVPNEIMMMSLKPQETMFWKSFSLRGLIGKIYRLGFKGLLEKKYSDYSGEQLLWKQWKDFIPLIDKEYDTAIAYIEGYCNFLVIDKVKAKNKVLWIHTQYSQMECNHDFDAEYFKKADSIVTISSTCVESILKYHNVSEKIYCLENISSKRLINKLAESSKCEEFANAKNKIKILSLGRLAYPKHFELAIETAAKLKSRNRDFIWCIVGEGPERDSLEALIEKYQLKDEVILTGLKSNPYGYIKNCDVFVQTSRYEGKSIVVDEAKILNKPIVCTNYDTVYDTLEDRVNGIITEMDSESLADAIEEVIDNDDLKQTLKNNLKNEEGNISEIKKYVELF